MEANQSLEQANGADIADDREYVKALRAATKAKALLALHGRGIDRIIDIANGVKDVEALAAIKLLGQLSGDLKAGHAVEVKLSFEDLRKKNDSGGDALSDLFDIRGDVIDAEEEDSGVDS